MNFINLFSGGLPHIVRYQTVKCLQRVAVAQSCSIRSQSTDTRSDVPHLYDVIITGGGMVGAAMAAALGNEAIFSDKKILLLEAGKQQKLDSVPANFSNRVCTISMSTVNLLTDIGAWKNICDVRLQPVKHMQVWDACADSMITFRPKDFETDLAYVVENDVILGSINKQIDTMSNVTVRYQSKVKGYRLPRPASEDASDQEKEDSQWARVVLDSGETLRSRLLIGADGFRSLLRQTAHIQTVEWEYNQKALVAVLQLTDDVENCVAWQRFLPTGPIAMLPLSNNRSCLIWTTTKAEAENLIHMSDESFVDAVNDAYFSEDDKNSLVSYATRLFDGVITTVGLEGSTSQQLPPSIIGVDKDSRATFPLGLCHSVFYAKPRLALIGDAAHRIHPLAGQGVNLGFGDVTSLKNQLVKAVGLGADIGSVDHLISYERCRQMHVLPMMATIDGLNRLYSTDWSPVVFLRAIGCQATNALGPLKERMIQFASS